MRARIALAVVAVCVAALAPQARLGHAASTINVPADFPTIQGAIGAASNGDTVLVAPGTYFESIDFMGKSIEVTSSAGPAVTIIDGSHSSPTDQFVVFRHGETHQSILRGFTIQRGASGGIGLQFSAPTIVGNVIQLNQGASGGGIYVDGSSYPTTERPVITDNFIAENDALGNFGGGLSMSFGAADIERNVFSGNRAGDGGAMFFFEPLGAVIRNNAILDNSGGYVGGIDVLDGTGVVVSQNILAGNHGTAAAEVRLQGGRVSVVANTIVGATGEGPSVYVNGATLRAFIDDNIIVGSGGQPALGCDVGDISLGGTAVVRFNDVFNPSGLAFQPGCGGATGVDGNISLDPLFVNEATHDFHLTLNSPSIDAGETSNPYLTTVDFDGGPRVFGAGVDQGAFEAQFLPPSTSTPTSSATPTLTATATDTPTLTPTQTPTATLAPCDPNCTREAAVYLALDCDPAMPGVQSDCYVGGGPGSFDVAVDVVNGLDSTIGLGQLSFEIVNPDTSLLLAIPMPAYPPCDSNPDFADLFGAWSCFAPPPTADDESPVDNPLTQHSFLEATELTFSGQSTVPPNSTVRVASVHYSNLTSSPTSAMATLSIANGRIADRFFHEIGSCAPAVMRPMQCPAATVHFGIPPPPATATPTATPTSMPIVPGVVKVPDGNANNTDPSVPAANLYLCIPGPCSGPGEGDLRVVEHAFNVHTGDQNGDTVEDGLGAYEFSVEYDNFVIQSVNPCDIVFGPTGAGMARGPVDEVNASSPANPDCSPDPNAANNGTCTMSLILENVVHFGCTTNGQTPGPTGDFDLASLDLIPHPDLANDIFPGNNNGVVTVLKDNGCELVDVFGHPVTGSINGGLTPTCGDLAVTVRILEGDLNLDCKVDVQDEQLIGYRYGSFFGSALYSKWYDLEPALHDLDIDVKDLQKVFGRDGSTCQNPIPAQTPVPPPVPFG